MPHLMQVSSTCLALLAEQTPPSSLDVGEERGAASKGMTEGAGCRVVLSKGLTFLCFGPLSRVVEEKPVIQEAATEPESSGSGLLFGCVFTGAVPCLELGWAAASLFAPRPSSRPTKRPMGKLSSERTIARDAF